MTHPTQGGTPAGDVALAIKRLARLTGGDVQELQTLYVLEALLGRLANSAYKDDFVLKGGVLLAAFAARRPTKDIDLQASGVSNDSDDVVERVREIAGLEIADGIVFDLDSISVAVIRDDDQYAGVRVKIVGVLGRSRLTIGIDINFGDPIWPRPSLVELPRVLQIGQVPLIVLGYPLTMVLAEKIVTAIDRGEANTRWRDFADVYTLIGDHHLDADELRSSLNVVGNYRDVHLRPLLPMLAQMPERAQTKWRAWRTRVSRENDLPVEFAEVLSEIANFSESVLDGNAEGQTWDATSRSWARKA